MDINVNDQVQVLHGVHSGLVGKVTHVRDVDDAPNKYRLLGVEDDWFLGWFTADQLTEPEPQAEPEESDPENADEKPEDENRGTGDA